MERWNALAGWRGLRDGGARRAFDGTFLAFEEAWGPNAELMANLSLSYRVANLGAGVAPDVIRARLDANIPAFFFLWSPHAFNAQHALNRIQLPQLRAAATSHEAGPSDFPTEMLEKVASKTLSELTPEVAEFYSRFRIDTLAQERMLAAIDAEELSAMQAACAWMRTEENAAVPKAWLPVATLDCDAGHYAATSCAPCPQGSASFGGAATACAQCSAGTTPPSCARVRCQPCVGSLHGRPSSMIYWSLVDVAAPMAVPSITYAARITLPLWHGVAPPP